MLKIKENFCLISNCIGAFIFVFYLFCNISYASTTGTVYLTANQEVLEKEEEVEITVNIENSKVGAFNFSICFDDSKLEYIKETENSRVIDNRIISVWYDEQGGAGAKEGELTKFKFKAKENGIATFTIQGEFYSEIGQLIQTDFNYKQIQIGKKESVLQKQAQEEQGSNLEQSNANLQSLRLEQEGITPSFSKEVFEYYLIISNNIQNLEVLAISENPNASIDIRGNTNLKQGLNDIIIEVVSEDKTQNKTYTIHTTKTANIELANTNLEILAIENVLLNPPFDINETNYKAEISNQTTEVNILAVPANEQATIEISGKNDLKEGHNLITIVVTAQNGFTKKNYQIDIYKRNLDEETKYQEEQKDLNEKLEQAYKIDKLSTNKDYNQEEMKEDKGNKKNIIFWGMAIVFVIVVLITFIFKVKHRIKK